MSRGKLRVRQPHFADDRWYSATPTELQKDIERYLADIPAAVEPAWSGQVLGLVAPHAGLHFSGHVAGAAFAGLTPAAFETVVLLGPDHRGEARGHVSTVDVDAWHTPLGDIPVARHVLDELQTYLDLKRLATDEEHCLEIELPFLQTTLKQFKLVPLMMGNQSLPTCRQLGEALVKTLAAVETGPALFVASSDLSHYFDDNTARHLDQATLQFMLELDAEGLIKHVHAGQQQGQPFACGAGPIAVVIHATKLLGATQARLLKYATSADVSSRRDRVVGYAAVAFKTQLES